MMSWETLVHLIQKIAAGTSISLNLLLTFLIVTKSPRKLGSYKYLMIYISWFEICYSIIDVALSPIMFSYESIFVVLIYAKNSFVPRWFMFIMNCVYCAFFGVSMGMFALHFIYRYFVSTGSKHLKTFNDARIIYWMMFPVIYGIVWGLLCYFTCAPSPAIDERISKPLFSTFSWEIDDVVYLGPYLYQLQPDGSHIIDYYAVSAVLIAWGILCSSLTAIFYFGVKCYIRLKNMMDRRTSSTSYNFKNLQAQLFYALVTQTIIPVILMHFPVSIVYLFSFLNKDLGTLSGITSITIALFPALDPLPTMFIVKSYRTTILGFFKLSRGKQESSSIGLQSMQNIAAPESRTIL